MCSPQPQHAHTCLGSRRTLTPCGLLIPFACTAASRTRAQPFACTASTLQAGLSENWVGASLQDPKLLRSMGDFHILPGPGRTLASLQARRRGGWRWAGESERERFKGSAGA